MFPRLQAFPDLRAIVDDIAQRLPDAIDSEIERIGLEAVAAKDVSELASEAVEQLLTESERQGIRDDDHYDNSDISEFVEIEIAFLLAERLNKGRSIAEIAAGPVALTSLQGALQYFMDQEITPGDVMNQTEDAAALSVVRKTGEKVIDKSLFGMQSAYYSITNSYWCRAKGVVQLSAVCAVLSQSWDEIGEFRR